MASIWDRLFSKPKKPTYNWNDILSGITPIYSNGFGDNIYASDVVQQAIYSIVTELKKLEPQHIRMNGNDPIPVNDSIQAVLENPNPLMTTSDYIEKIVWNLMLNYNSFVFPVWEGDKLKYLYPLQPSKVEFQQLGDEVFTEFTFPNGYTGTLPYSSIIHMRYHYSVSDYMGGNKDGQPDFKPILDTLKLNDTLLKGLAKSLNFQTQVNGAVKIKTMKDYDEQMARVNEFEKMLEEGKSGFLAMDVSADYVPISKQIALLDSTVLEFLDKKILRSYGVSIPIVNGDFTKEQYEAFYQKTLEPIIKSICQAHTKGIFSNRAAFGYGNKIAFYPQELLFLSTSQKLEAVHILGDRGQLYDNEVRVAMGLRPLPELEGKRTMSLNYIDANAATEYQMGDDTNAE